MNGLLPALHSLLKETEIVKQRSPIGSLAGPGTWQLYTTIMVARIVF